MKKSDKEIAEKARRRQAKQNEYIKANFDRISIVIAKGYKERIVATGSTVNGFIVDAIREKLERVEAEKERENNSDYLPFS